MNLVCQGLYSFSDIWLNFWTAEEEIKLVKVSDRFPVINVEIPFPQHHADMADLALPSPVLYTNQTMVTKTFSGNTTYEEASEEELLSEHYYNLGVYGAIIGVLCVTSMVRTIYFFVICMKSSVKLHDTMFESIIRAPCRFFDTNPVGKCARNGGTKSIVLFQEGS